MMVTGVPNSPSEAVNPEWTGLTPLDGRISSHLFRRPIQRLRHDVQLHTDTER